MSCHVLLDCGVPEAASGATSGEIRVFSKCRNERLRLPDFLRHYRALGAQRFFITDNDSTDGSREYLMAQPDVRVFRTSGSFRQARGGTDWLNAMLEQFGGTHWCVTVDVDELLYYPGSETTGLRALTAHLDQGGYQAMQCLLLDMYPGGPLARTAYAEGDSLVAAAPYFDPGPYRRFPHLECPGVLIYGGVRERIFYPAARADDLPRKLHVALYHRLLPSFPRVRDHKRVAAHKPLFPPCLTKVPLVRWDASTKYVNVNHFVSDRRVAPETGALLHFKFLQDFHDRAVLEAKRGEYYDGAVEFRVYTEKLRANPELSLRDAASTRFEDSAQLERLGLIAGTKAWADARGAQRST
jgi:hypothetical protein